MKIACVSVLFRKYPFPKCLDILSGLGYEYVETEAMSPFCPHVNVDLDDPVQFAELVKGSGIRQVTALWMAHGRIIAEPASVETAVRSLEWCAAAGIPILNTGDGMKPDGMSDADAFSLLRDRLFPMIEAAERIGVILALEPHGTFSLTGEGLRRIAGISNSPFFGINYDAANIFRSTYVENVQGSSFSYGKTTAEGAKREDELEVLEKIADRVVNYHAKDVKEGECCALGDGSVKNDACIGLLKQRGYDQVLSVETDGNLPLEEETEIARRGLQTLRRYL
ncbi:MAG: sugar phosphate isomerase/epimerase [Planctomycetota bacterium]|jgi:sugar phosphate isomerase/epimerase|nr:sugar phosphate isomerase/epimerase [Planctomycetota bacterium]